MSYNGFEMYDVTLAFGETKIGGNMSNEVLMDWIELLWFPYFAVIFTVLGRRLKRTSALIYNLRMFGIYSVWLLFRQNPVYISATTCDELMRCLAAATLAAVVQRVLRMDFIVLAWTIVTIGAGYAIVCFDPLMRARAGCEKEAGPPTEDFPHGVWLGCDDWEFAYFITWIYLGSTYLAVLIVCCCVRNKTTKNETLSRFSNEFAVSMVATSAFTTATRAFVRRLELDSKDSHDDALVDFFSIYLDLCFYLYLAITFMVQEGIHRSKQPSKGITPSLEITIPKGITPIKGITPNKGIKAKKCKQGCKCCIKILKPIFHILKPIFHLAAAPFYLVEKILKKIEKWFVKYVDEPDEDEDDEDL